MTDPAPSSDVPEADRAEQQASVEPIATGDVAPPGDGVPEADALEQQLPARAGEAGIPAQPVGDREANEADVLEQEVDVPVDDDEIPG